MKKQLFFASLLACMLVPVAACEKTETTDSESSPVASAPAEETHTYVEHEEAAATCDKDGNEKYYTCEDCDKIFDADKAEIDKIPTLAVLGHDYTFHAAANGTCNSKGMPAYYTCGDCGKTFDLSKQETTIVEGELNPFNHTAQRTLILQAQPEKTEYAIGETFNPSGMVVVYKCEDCDGTVVDNQQLSYTYENGTAFASGDEKVTVTFNNLSFDVAITVGKAKARIEGVEESYTTVCGIAPDIKATSNIPSCEIFTAYFDGESEVTAEELVYGKTYTAKVWIETTELIEGAEALATVSVEHEYGWKNDENNWQKVYYQCNCGDKEAFYALDYQSRYVDEDDLSVDLSGLVFADGQEVSIKSVQQIVRLTSGGVVEAKDGEVVEIGYTNDGMQYTFSADKYERLTEAYKPYILTLSVVYQIGELECPLVVEVKFVDKLIKNANDLQELAYTGGVDAASGGTENTKYYVLANDIDASGVSFDSKPAFGAAFGFKGVLEGNGHTVSNVNITGGQGVFGAIGDGARIQNISFEKATVAEGNYLLAYCIRGAILNNVNVEFAQGTKSYLVTYSANGCTFDKVSVTTDIHHKPLLIDENADAEYPAGLTISYFPYSTVSFDTDGGNAIESVVVTNGNMVELPAQPTKAPSADCKYEFIGWYFNESEWDFNTPITEDITLVAKWKEVERVTIAQVEEAINALPNSASMPTGLSKVPAIMNASALYNELTEGEKAQVGNASKMESLLAAIQGYETVYVPDEYGVKAIPCHVVNNPSTVAVTGALATDAEQGAIFVGTSGAGGRVSIQFQDFPSVSQYDKIYFYVRSTTEGYLYISDGTSNNGWGANWKNNYEKIAASYGKNQVVKNTWCLMEFDVADGYFSSDWAIGIWGSSTDYTLEIGAVVGCKIAELPVVDKVEVALDFGAKTDSGESNEYGKVYNISREQWYIDTNNGNTIGTLQTGKLANALPEGFDHFELWIYNGTGAEYNFHLAGDVSGAWTDSKDSTPLKVVEWTKVVISAEDIQLNKNGQWYVYLLGGDGQGAAKDGWKISTIYAVK